MPATTNFCQHIAHPQGDTMKIAIGQLNPVIGDFHYNISLMQEATDRARSKGCRLIILPEMCTTGYPPRDLLERPAFVRENLDQLERFAAGVKGISVICGYVDQSPKRTGKPLVNSVALISEGRVKAKGGKRLLPTYDVFDETRYFEPAPRSLVFEMDGLRWGVTLCEDIWSAQEFPEVPRYELDPIPDLTSRDIDMLVNISASPYSLNKGQTRLKRLRQLSTENRINCLYCNQVGGNDDLLFDGSTMVVDPEGRLILLGKQFEQDFLIWDTERSYAPVEEPWPEREDSVLKGLVMGTRDYARKCGFERVLVGLSGGVDSSLVAYIAREAMGADQVTGISMPSPYTSLMSREDARELARHLGIHFEEIAIDDLFDGYKQALDPLFHGLEEDETEENIQARIRGNLLMALSNKFDSLLLTTGNKSEFATGYCTLYGDLTGGLAVISDIPKTLCFRLARFVNRDEEVIPSRIITRPPSAELRKDQKDEDTLPRYEVLDDILEAAVEKNLGLSDIVSRGHDPAVVHDVLRRIAFNEYKRRQAPPGLKITSKAFGYGRRYPIARGRDVF